ncbi:acetylcholine receptor subunit beta-like 1 isoform X2 [Paramacrobiotus metropolitanus]|uniref:acetylcholine receptor subunit beta-like 1 isoform X2 n=1 Tax=Paramacrobiotus metropolitanus TaxID=2943436 RepID=UPI0024457424|nr:acetylcholine receptor subunit beta-like 1 isoform X2 [Paramacrobiotus metropolitanus]
MKLCASQIWCAFSLGITCLNYSVSCSDDQERLVRDLFRNYNPLLRPVENINYTVNVSFALTLGLLIYVNERQQVMKTNGYTNLEWKDPQFVWDAGEYGGITAIRVPVDKVWTPDIVLITNTDGKFGPSYKSNAVIYSGGSVNWLPPFIYRSSCQIQVVNFPFDQQCEMRFSSWTYDAHEVDIHPKSTVVDVSNYLKGGIWDLVDARIHRVAYDQFAYASRGRVPRVDIIVTIVIRRKALFYTVNLLIPTVLIAFMTVFVFLLPTVAGEKITLTISLTLTIVVFLLLVSKILPPADTMPLISRFLLFIFIMNLISVFITVITINLNYRGPKTHDMPEWLRVIFLKIFPPLLLMRRPPIHLLRRNKSKLSDYGKTRETHPYKRSAVFSRQRAAPIEYIPMTNQRGTPVTIAGLRFMDDTDSVEGEEFFELSQHPDAAVVANSVETIAANMEWNNEIKLIEEDWKYFALVVDRILLWIFFWGTCIGSMWIILGGENIFIQIDEEATIERLKAMI